MIPWGWFVVLYLLGGSYGYQAWTANWKDRNLCHALLPAMILFWPIVAILGLFNSVAYGYDNGLCEMGEDGLPLPPCGQWHNDGLPPAHCQSCTQQTQQQAEATDGGEAV